jgi:hypothetical protein
MRTLSHEKASARKNLNDSAGTRHRFSHKMFASRQCSYIAVFPEERFLGRKFPYEIFLSKRFQTEILSERRILAEKLAGRSIVAEQFVPYSQEKMFSEKRLEIFSEKIPGSQISGKDPLHENSNSLLPRQLGFEADMRLKEVGLEKVS